jgi:hypothetical protein
VWLLHRRHDRRRYRDTIAGATAAGGGVGITDHPLYTSGLKNSAGGWWRGVAHGS